MTYLFTARQWTRIWSISLRSYRQQHQLFAKLSKCSFGKQQLDYLGHIISKDGVSVDPEIRWQALLNGAPRRSRLYEDSLALRVIIAASLREGFWTDKQATHRYAQEREFELDTRGSLGFSTA